MRGPTGYSVSQPLVNYPITGPILSGPHMTPYECRTKESGLGEPTDANCSAPTKYEWFYKPAGGGAYKAFDRKAARPTDVARRRRSTGRPSLHRACRKRRDRSSIYRIAVLDDPATDGISDERRLGTGGSGVTFGGGAGRNTIKEPTSHCRAVRSLSRARLCYAAPPSW